MCNSKGDILEERYRPYAIIYFKFPAKTILTDGLLVNRVNGHGSSAGLFN
jgi:hypothetical protein